MNHTVHSATRKSPHHDTNQDASYIGDNLLIVADGMGGEACGDVASAIAVRTVAGALQTCGDDLSDEDAHNLVKSAIISADREIGAYIRSNPEACGMGTTIIVALRCGDRLHVGWCGDSRCLVYDGLALRQLTRDHSYVQELVECGLLTVEESYSHPDNNVVTRCVGGGAALCRPEFVSYTLREGDTVILCSDGLSGYCRDYEIERCVSRCDNPSRLPERLSELALRCGSEDDITIVTASFSRRSSFFGWLKRVAGTS